MKHYFKVDQARHRALAKQWMRHSPGYPVWIVATVLLLLFGVYVGASSYLDFCVNAINKDTVPMMTVASVVFGLLACVPALFPYKVWRIVKGGQLYYMAEMQLYCDEQTLYFSYHPRKDRHFPQSILVNFIPFSDIRKVRVERDIRLVTVEGDSQYELYRTALGLQYQEDTSSGRFAEWKSFRFFLCLEDEADFFDVLAKHNVRIEYV